MDHTRLENINSKNQYFNIKTYLNLITLTDYPE